MNRHHAKQHPHDSRLEARIASYELAAKMQLSAPEAFDVTREPESVHKSYGLDDKVTEDFGRRCLLATRLIERGVRFVQVVALCLVFDGLIAPVVAATVGDSCLNPCPPKPAHKTAAIVIPPQTSLSKRRASEFRCPDDQRVFVQAA